ncbi:MAG: helix-turn-helix transcriptional regulator [Dehalococcoidia bacterium]
MTGRPAHYESRVRADLTTRQAEILRLVAQGRTNREIAAHFGMTLDGAKWHLGEIMQKLGAVSREEAVSLWQGQHSGSFRHRFAVTLGPTLKLCLWASAAGAAVVAAAAVWTSLHRDSSDASELSSNPAIVFESFSLPELPTQHEIMALAVQANSYPQPDKPLPLPLLSSDPSDARRIDEILAELARVPAAGIDPDEPYLWGSPHAIVILTEGLLNVGVAMDCRTTATADGQLTECSPLPGKVDVMRHSSIRPGRMARYDAPLLYAWLTQGWSQDFEFGSQAEWNEAWTKVLQEPSRTE